MLLPTSTSQLYLSLRCRQSSGTTSCDLPTISHMLTAFVSTGPRLRLSSQGTHVLSLRLHTLVMAGALCPDHGTAQCVYGMRKRATLSSSCPYPVLLIQSRIHRMAVTLPQGSTTRRCRFGIPQQAVPSANLHGAMEEPCVVSHTLQMDIALHLGMTPVLSVYGQ